MDSRPRASRPSLRTERQRPRRVDHDHLGARRRVRQRTHQVGQAYALDRNIAFTIEPRIDAKQEVVTLERDRVSGEIDEGQRLWTGSLDLAEKLAIALDQVGLAQVGALDDLEADAAQRLGNKPRVVESIRDCAGAVRTIADDEGDARLGPLLCLHRQRAGASERHRGKREQENSTYHGSPPDGGNLPPTSTPRIECDCSAIAAEWAFSLLHLFRPSRSGAPTPRRASA